MDDTAQIWIVATGTRFDLDGRANSANRGRTNSANREYAVMMRLYTNGCAICIMTGLYLMMDSKGDPLMFIYGLLIGLIGAILGAKARGAI